MNRCRLETIRAYWSGRVVAYSAVNADELGTIQAKVWDELIAEQSQLLYSVPDYSEAEINDYLNEYIYPIYDEVSETLTTKSEAKRS